MCFSLECPQSILAYRGDEGGIKGILAEPEQQTCLSHAAVSDKQQFKQIVVCFRHLNKPSGSGRVGFVKAARCRLRLARVEIHNCRRRGGQAGCCQPVPERADVTCSLCIMGSVVSNDAACSRVR